MTKTAIITGANKGIGLAVAKRLIQHDYRVVLACRNTEKGLMAAVSEIGPVCVCMVWHFGVPCNLVRCSLVG